MVGPVKVVVAANAAASARSFVDTVRRFDAALRQLSSSALALAHQSRWEGITAERFRTEQRTLSVRAGRLGLSLDRMARGAQAVIDDIDREDAAGAAGRNCAVPGPAGAGTAMSVQLLPLAPLSGLGKPFVPTTVPAHYPPGDGPSTPPVTNFGPPLSVTIIGKETAYIDSNGVPHILGGSGDKPTVNRSLDFMNLQLDREGESYNVLTQTGSKYFLQNDRNSQALVPKGRLGNGSLSGTTADMVKVTWDKGKIVSIESVDATDSNADPTSSTRINQVAQTINNKLAKQTQNVVFVADSEEQAKAVAAKFTSNPNVRVVYPPSGFDSGEFGNAASSSPFAPPSRGQAVAAAEIAAEAEAEAAAAARAQAAAAAAEAEAEAIAIAEAEALAEGE